MSRRSYEAAAKISKSDKSKAQDRLIIKSLTR